LCLHPRHDQPIATSNPISSPESEREREGGRGREIGFNLPFYLLP
jgi:hypothetical protein